MISAWISGLLLAQVFLVPGVPAARRSGTLAPDQTDEFYAFWNMDDAANGTRLNDTLATSGSACDLTDATSGVALSTTTGVVEGTGAADFEEADALDRLTNASASCMTGVSFTDFSVGCYYYVESATGNGSNLFYSWSGGTGVIIRLDTTDEHPEPQIDGVICNADTAMSAGNQYAVSFVYDGTADTIQPYMNGSTDGSSCPQSAFGVTDDILISSDGTRELDGYVDACWIHESPLTAAEICYLCSAGGPANAEGLTCSGSSFADEGTLWDTLCGSCTLPSDCTNPITTGE